jgi:hypothetical protein
MVALFLLVLLSVQGRAWASWPWVLLRRAWYRLIGCSTSHKCSVSTEVLW